MPEIDAPRLRGVLHQIAFFVAGAAGIALVVSSGWQWSLVVYAASLALMLGTSAAYHRGSWSARARRWWQRADHAAIFVFIAGSYTPLCALALPPWPGHALLAAVWGGAALGVARALAWPSAPRWVVASLYVVLGWVMIVALPAVVHATGVPVLAVILAGGALYTVGAAIYAAGWPDPWPRTFGYHEVFHALTIAAAIAHFGAVVVLARP
ncbi:MAG: hemolysin III family protein [Myxococcales bacterium]|nr:hemolysin III family protein [Myxococcales bacterium]